MTPLEEKIFVTSACQKLQERGWFPGEEFVPSAITEQEIVAFEREHQVKLPSLYRAFLTSFRLPQHIRNDNFICSIIEDEGDLGPLWLAIDCPRSMSEVSKSMEILQEIRDFCDLPKDCFQNLIPIGDWGAGWGRCVSICPGQRRRLMKTIHLLGLWSGLTMKNLIGIKNTLVKMDCFTEVRLCRI